MSYDVDDTIAAIATAAGGAARGIVRVSGSTALEIVAGCFTAADGRTLDPIRHPSAVAGQFAVAIDQDQPRQLPCDLFLWPTDRSYTRQPVAELHTLGSPRLLQAVLESVCRGGARLAEPGEFTLRAFLAGRIDLTQAEAVLGVIDAEQADQLRTALGQLAGGLAKPLHHLREDLLHLLAEIEAGLDFVEEDIEFISAAELMARLRTVGAELHDVAAQLNSRSVDAAAVQLVLIGPPNAGKSSLFNAMIRRFAATNAAETSAIVSAERGTTRDYLTATIDLGGSHCTLIDTAGIESSPALITTDEVSQRRAAEISVAAQNLSGEVQRQATLRALCVDVSLVELDAALGDVACDLLVLTQADRAAIRHAARHRDARVPVVVTSSVTGEGLEEFRTAIRDLLSATAQSNRGDAVVATAERCRESLRTAESALGRATEMAETQSGNELIAAELRGALAELGKVVGAVYTDDILDRIFSTFCIGK